MNTVWMGRKSDLVHEKKQRMSHKNYDAPSCGELKKTVRQQDSFRGSKKDRLIVLEKLLEFSRQNKKNGNYYTSEFYSYVNKMLSVKVCENELCYMIYCLRKQYLDHECGVDEEDSKDDDLKVIMKLSEKLWGGGDGMKKGWWGRDNYYEGYLEDYVVEELGFSEECLTSSIVDEIKNDWEHFLFLQDQFRTMQRRFTLQLCQLRNNIHNAQITSTTSNV